MRAAIVFPAYNEAENLRPLFEKVSDLLSLVEHTFVVIAVDDGSVDNTPEICQEFSQKIPLRSIRHPRNLGLGAALRTGLRAAMAEGVEAIVTLDADDTQDPALIPAMLAKLAINDVVVASRFCPGGEMIGVPPFRVLVSTTASRVLRLFFPISGVRDYTCGFRAYRVELLQRLADTFGPELFSEQGFACMFEILLRVRKLRARADEVPLVLRYDLKRGASKMRVFRTALRYLRVLFRSA